MKVSSKGNYALQMMLYLAKNENSGYISIREISGAIHVNIKYLEQIANLLGKAGLLRVARGSSGGYCLIRRPADYSVLEILQAVEGSLAPVRCLETPENFCEHSGDCPSLPFWTEYYDVIRSFLEKRSLEDILNEGSARNSEEGKGYESV